jgi:hypothetical protein
MIPLHRIVVALLILLASSAQGQDTEPKIYYVSREGPTLSKVASLLRPGDTVRLRRGDVLNGPFKLGVSDITVEAYGDGPNPVITGLRPVTGWKTVGNGRYEATLTEFPERTLELVRWRGRLQPKGRLPKKGFADGFRIKSHVKNRELTTLDDIPDVTGAEIVQKKYQWIIDRGRIDRIVRRAVGDRTEATIAFTDDPGTTYECFDKHRFFVQNHVACLTEPGDWCADAATRKLSVYAGSSPPGERDVDVAVVDVLADLSGASHLRFADISFVGSNSDAVLLDRSTHVTFERCDFSSIGRNAIHVARVEGRPWHRESHHGTVKNCRIADVNNNGIDLGGNPRWTIVGNTIERIGMNPGMGRNGDGQYIGIFEPGDESLVQYNEVSHIGYIAIHFVGSGTQIRNNHVHHFCMTKSDGGGIYTYAGHERKSFSKPRVVDRNIVHDGVGNIDGVGTADSGNPYSPQCQGIYMDGNTSDVVITGNTVFKVASSGLWLGSNGRIRALGNTLADNHMMQLGIDDQTASPAELEVRDNLCVAFEREQLCLSVSLQRKPAGGTWAQYVAAAGTLANNAYCRPVREPDGVRTKGYPRVPTFEDYPGGGVVSTGWDGLFLSLDVWQKEYLQDVGSKKTARTVEASRDLQLVYNPTNSPVLVELSGAFEDVAGVVYRKSIILAPYSSAVLMRRSD